MSTSRPICGSTGCPASLARPGPAHRALRGGRRLGDRGRRRPDQLRHERLRRPRPEEMQGWVRFEDIRRGRLRPQGPASRRWTATASTPRCSTRRRACRTAIVANPDAEYHLAMVRAYNDWLSEYVALRPGAVRRPGHAAQPGRQRSGGRDRPGPRPPRHPRRGDGLLSQRHPRHRTRGRQGLGLRWPSAASPSASTCRSVQTMPRPHRAKLPGLRPLLRRAQPDDRDDLRRASSTASPTSTWSSPRSTAAGCRTSRSRSTTTTTAWSRSAASACTASPSEYIDRHFHFGYMTDTFGLRVRATRRRRADPVVERLSAHQRRLAVLVAHHPGLVLGHPAGGAPS